MAAIATLNCTIFDDFLRKSTLQCSLFLYSLMLKVIMLEKNIMTCLRANNLEFTGLSHGQIQDGRHLKF